MFKKFFLYLSVALFFLCAYGLAHAETYGGVDFPEGSLSFADQVISYTTTSDVHAPYDNPAEALGLPDYNSNEDTGSVSLGDGGSIVLKFTDNALTTSGDNSDDLWIFEIGGMIEPTSVEISTDGNSWIYVGATGGGIYGIDIDAYIGSGGVVLWEKYQYVRLVDLLPHQSGAPYEGADIDAVGAISSTAPVPVPGSIGLLFFGLLGFTGLKRR